MKKIIELSNISNVALGRLAKYSLTLKMLEKLFWSGTKAPALSPSKLMVGPVELEIEA